jgi:hypothetical protein
LFREEIKWIEQLIVAEIIVIDFVFVQRGDLNRWFTIAWVIEWEGERETCQHNRGKKEMELIGLEIEFE